MQELRIGVTGHRILADIPKLRRGIKEAVNILRDAFPGRVPVALSSIAEGADRLVADAVLAQPNGRLIAVLPLPVDDYRTDFSTPESGEEFDLLLGSASEIIVVPEEPDRNAAYESAGRYNVEHADALIAVWDGQGAQGQGGTAEIVALARDRQMPIAIVRAGNRKPGTKEPTTLGEVQGEVVVENIPGRRRGHPE